MARGSKASCSWGSLGVLILVVIASLPLVVLVVSADGWPQLASPNGVVDATGAVDGARLADAERRAVDAELRAQEAERIAAETKRLADELVRNSSQAAKTWWLQAETDTLKRRQSQTADNAQGESKESSHLRGGLRGPVKTGSGTSYLVKGEVLTVGQYLLDEDGASHLIMQPDGHLVVYRGPDPKSPKGYMWGTGKAEMAGKKYSTRMEEKFFAVYRDVKFQSQLWSLEGTSRCGNGDDASNAAETRFLWLHPGGRLSVHLGSPQQPGEEVWSNGLGIPTTSGKPRRYIYYERDRAGFNNVKLQLQALVALAAISDRILVLPARSHIDHQSAYFFDFDFFDASEMSRLVDIAVGKGMDSHTFEVRTYLYALDWRTLPADKDWYFPHLNSRIQHFECMPLSRSDAAVAANAVLRGLPFDRHLEEMATAALTRLGIGPDVEFDAVHIRRGDFNSFAKHFMMTDAQLTKKLQDKLHGKGRPVLVASDERLKIDVGGSKVVYASDAYSDEHAFTRVAVDMIMSSRAATFVGTPMSTFTNGIFELRKRKIMLQGAKIDPNLTVYAGSSKTTGQGTCWDKVTTFEAEAKCEKGVARCLRPC